MKSYENLLKYFKNDLYLDSIIKVYNEVKKIKNKEEIVGICKEVLEEKALIQNKKERVVLIKVLISLYPYSIEIIRDLLNTKISKNDYEIHFTLFCYLNFINENHLEYKNELKNELINYLINVPQKTAYAAWMLGDMLGAHWDLTESVPILIIAASHAKYLAGRLGALHGLEHALKKSPPFENIILLSLKNISRKDSSSEVREYASGILMGKNNK